MKRQRESDSSNEYASSAEHGSESDGSESEKSEGDDSLLLDIKSRLENSLSYLPRAMSFASSGPCPIEVNPAISISGLGGIGLPLSERDAELVSNASHPAPFGKGSDTVVDPAVRKTRELCAEQFELRNPEWDKALKAVVCKVATELHVPSGAAGVKAVLYKMLLYGKGAMFKEHRDSEKEPGMFGTLVICLPSKHEGGDVHVIHGAQRKTLGTAEFSEFNYTYLCWYGDVKHEITEVTSGYRLVLTYNLINANPKSPAQVPIALAGKMKELEEALLFWKDNYKINALNCPSVLAYILEHLYTEQTSSYSGLKGGDHLRGLCLSELCKKHGFLFYLAKLELQVDGECSGEDNEDSWREMYWRARHNEEPDIHFITEITEEYLGLRRIVELDGTKLLDKVPFSESQIVQDDPFNGDPDYEEFSGPTGNEGVSATHFYHRSVAILMPIEYRIDFFFQSYKASGTDMGGWVDQLIEHYDSSNADSKSAERDLAKACRLITQGANQWLAANIRRPFYAQESTPFYTDGLLGKVMRGSLRLNDQSLCCEALRAVIEELPQPTTVWVIKRFGFAQIKSELDAAIWRFRHIHQSLRALVGVYDRYRDLEGQDSQLPTGILTWMEDQTQKLLTCKRVDSTRDGQIAVEAGIRCGENYLIKQLEPAFRFQIRKAKDNYRWMASAVLGFLINIGEGWKSDKMTLKTAQDVFRAVLEDFIPSIKLADPDERGKRMRISDWSYRPSTFLDSEQIVQLLRQCVSLDLGSQVQQLFDKLERLGGDEEPVTVFEGFFLPLAKELNKMSAEQSPGALAQEVRNMASLFTEKLPGLYASRCVGPKPTPPMDWRRTKCGCGCMECLELDSFLVDPAQEEMQISVSSEDRLRHLQEQLPLIHQGIYKRDRPEHETEIRSTTSGFELSIRKTKLAWNTATKRWIEDRDAAKKAFDLVFDDKDIRRRLEKVLQDLGGEDVTESAI